MGCWRGRVWGAVRFGFRLVHYAVMGNHVHLIVEAEDRRALWRGMQGLGVRIAKGMNRLMGRAGRVLVDRYHAHILRTPTEVRAARVVSAAQRRGALWADGRGSVCVAGRGGEAADVVGGAVVVSQSQRRSESAFSSKIGPKANRPRASGPQRYWPESSRPRW